MFLNSQKAIHWGYIGFIKCIEGPLNFVIGISITDSSSDSDEAKKPLKPSLNKPLPVKPSDVPSGRFPKPVAKKRPNVPLKPSRVSDEQNDSSPNFLSQVKLKHVNRPAETVEKEVTSNNPLQPPKREPSPLRFGRSSDLSDKNALQNHTGPSFMGQKNDRSVSPQAPGRNFPPTRPVPNARPTEKKSFLHAYLDKNPEVSNQRIPPKLVPKLVALYVCVFCCMTGETGLSIACCHLSFALVYIFFQGFISSLIPWNEYSLIAPKHVYC